MAARGDDSPLVLVFQLQGASAPALGPDLGSHFRSVGGQTLPVSALPVTRAVGAPQVQLGRAPASLRLDRFTLKITKF